MEALKILEDKVIMLVEVIGQLREDKQKLIAEKKELSTRIEELESSLQDDARKTCELNKERENASVLLDDLIRSIDSLVEGEIQ